MPEHFCTVHNCKFYQNTKGDKVWYSHKIKGTDEYCNEPKAQTPAPQPTPAPVRQTEAVKESPHEQLSGDEKNRSMSISYAKDLAVAGKIELKDITSYADKFLAYILKKEVKSLVEEAKKMEAVVKPTQAATKAQLGAIPKITKEQIGEINLLVKQQDVNANDFKAITLKEIGRETISLKDFTASEASKVIAKLQGR